MPFSRTHYRSIADWNWRLSVEELFRTLFLAAALLWNGHVPLYCSTFLLQGVAEVIQIRQGDWSLYLALLALVVDGLEVHLLVVSQLWM